MNTSRSSVIETQAEEVTIHRQTNIQTFSPEQEMKYLVERGDWEQLVETDTFLQRAPEAKLQLFTDAINARIEKVRGNLRYMITGGESKRQASMGILQKIRKLEQLRDDTVQNFYEKGDLELPENAGVKIEFY